MDPFTIAMIMIALGEGVKYNESRRAAKRTKAAVGQGEKRQDEINDQRRQLVLKNLEQYDPVSRAVKQEDVAAETTQGLQEVLNTAGETGSIPAAQGKVSETYTTERAKSLTDNLKRSSIMASLMGKVRAPNDLRFEEAMKGGE